MKNTVKLTEKSVSAIAPTGVAQKFADERGLYLYVSQHGTKSWRYDYRVGGKRATLTLGKYPDISLANARKKHLEARTTIANGGHPAQEKKIEKLERQVVLGNTFDEVSKKWYVSKEARRSKVWRDTHSLYLKRDLSPPLGLLPVAEIKAKTLLAALEKCRERSGIRTADRVRQTAVQVFDFAKRKLKVTSNVARELVDWTDGEMPAKKHRAWLKADELPGFLKAVETYPGYLTTKLAAKLLLHTFVRKSELVDAKWSEFSFENALWSVPPERMKMPTEEKGNRHNFHLVPLSTQVVTLLKELKPLCSGSDYLFPSNSSLEKPMGHSTLNVMFKRLGYGDTLTPHGMRATASTVLNEKGFRGDAIELQLAHVERNSVRRAYNHSELLPERALLMQYWSDFLEGCEMKNAKQEERHD